MWIIYGIGIFGVSFYLVRGLWIQYQELKIDANEAIDAFKAGFVFAEALMIVLLVWTIVNGGSLLAIVFATIACIWVLVFGQAVVDLLETW
ncbi:hypothetical protein KC573_04385 [candidate division WWE3 bacterium]|uniref:Uncharacterized protein n=1 Tax=candidate division WWE3 bacterium TaxID=2053526 RepID=A0A955LWP1_UNCKA|nr:hypothetical protein [candidate division WWE3 bacterium]